MYYPRIKKIRNEQNKTQTEIANLLFITQQPDSLYESGTREIPVSSLRILSKFYGVTTDYLLGLTDEKNQSPVNK